MGRSRRLITASYIMSFIAAQAPKKISTDTIAKWVKIHPARVRQIVSELVKGGLINSQRGAKGGLLLARPAIDITLFDIYKAMNERSMLSEGLDNPFSEWADHCRVHPTFVKLYDDMEDHMRHQLAQITIESMISSDADIENITELALSA